MVRGGGRRAYSTGECKNDDGDSQISSGFQEDFHKSVSALRWQPLL